MVGIIENIIGIVTDMGFLLLVVVLFVIMHMIQKSNYRTYYIYPNDISMDFSDSVRTILNNSKINNRYDIRETDDVNNADITIQLAHRDELTKYHTKEEYYPNGSQIRFSFTHKYPKPRIQIDHVNWVYGVPQSGLTLQQYRKYVIQHEFMHALGFDHQPCNKDTAIFGVCPILYQSTRGPPPGFKCGFEVTDIDYTKTF